MAAIAALLCWSTLTGVDRAEADTRTFLANADAHVTSAAPNLNFGSQPNLRIDGDPTTRTYLRFAVNLPAGAIVTRTRLRLDFASGSSNGFSANLATTNNWNESTINFANAPGFGPSVAQASSVPTGLNWLDVPPVDPNSGVTYVLARAHTDTLIARSRETTSKPRLIVEYRFLEATTLEPDSATWATTIADFDRNGREDFLVTRHGSIPGGDPLSLQQPGGSFVHGQFFPPGKDRHGCAAGDVNGDTRPDLYCMLGADRGTGAKENELWIAQPTGGYVDQAAAWGVTDPFGRGRRPILFDFNSDGRLDLYITNFFPREDPERSENILYLNQGNTHFVERVVTATGTHGSTCVDSGDWNEDARPDLLVCGSRLRLFRNVNGKSTQAVDDLLGTEQVSFPRDATLADVNGDDLNDLILVTTTELQIRLNRGSSARFAVVHHRRPLVNGMSIAVGDLTTDGVPDVYVVEGAANDVNVNDVLLVGPNWRAVTAPPVATGHGEQAEFITVQGREEVLVTNGFQTFRGPIQLIGLTP